MIRFIEDRQLLSGERVKAGDERDFGESENAAFVRNQVAEYVSPPAAAAGEEINPQEVTAHG